MSFTKQEYTKLFQYLTRLLPLTARPLGLEEIADVSSLIERVKVVSASSRAGYERGAKVFEWRIPREQAPTMNEYAHLKGWQKKQRSKGLDDALNKLLPTFPNALLHGAQRKRWVRVTRFSTQRVDELSIDILGGKMPLDCLVRAGVFADDNEVFLHREPRAEITKRGNTHVFVEVFECAVDEVPEADPVSVMIQQIEHKPGIMTRMLKAPHKGKGRRVSIP